LLIVWDGTSSSLDYLARILKIHNRFNVISLSTILSGVLILAMWYTSTAERNLLAFSALYGFASGPFFSLITVCHMYRQLSSRRS
jgi:hypothetical protein